MKKYLLLLCLTATCFVAARAQQFNADSILHIAETTNNDSIRIDAIQSLLLEQGTGSLDSLLAFSSIIIKYGQVHQMPHLEAAGDLFLCYAFYRMGNLAKQQTYVLKAAEILDKYPNNILQGVLLSFYSFFQPTDSLKILYGEKAVSFLKGADKTLPVVYSNLSNVFEDENQPDSALQYVQKAYDIVNANKDDNSTALGYIAANLSSIHSQLHQFDLALAYAKMSLVAAQKDQSVEMVYFAESAMAIYFDSTHQQDSAFYYWSKIYNEPRTSFYKSKIGAANWLYKYYDKKDNKDSTLKYLKIYVAGNDSLNNVAKAQQIEKINLQENMRQQQLAAQQEKEKEVQKHNIQFVVIAIGILIAIILFLLLSRSFIVSHKAIEILGVIMLLIVFEFINLLLHDYLSDHTNNSPLLMLLGLVAVAAVIVPFHHRLEKWATKKLVEKNKEVRLAKAKKIVEQLGGK